MTVPGDDRVHLATRNAAMREQVDQLLDQFTRQTERLREAQSSASRASATVTSKDGLVKATIDATGSLSDLTFAPSAFERSTPEALARTVLDVVRRGGTQVRQEVGELMAPLSGDMPDLADLVEGAPSLRGLMPTMPDVPAAERPDTPGEFQDREGESVMHDSYSSTQPRPAPRARARRRDEPDVEEPRETWLTGGRD